MSLAACWRLDYRSRGNQYNHWMTVSAAYRIYYAIQDFRTHYPSQATVCVNNMALPIGGKFDILQNWDSPHRWHDRGIAVDINMTQRNTCSSQSVGGIPQVLADEFLGFCLRQGADPSRSVVETTNIHCNWPDPFTPRDG